LNAVWFELVYFYTHPLSESVAVGGIRQRQRLRSKKLRDLFQFVWFIRH
jgi:hypothetical protein